MDKTVGVLGSGIVGVTLANGLQELGYDVSVGSRDGKKINDWSGKVGKFSEVSSRAELIILAVKGSVVESLVTTLKDSLTDKTIIDATNPISDSAPEDGVISYFTSLEESLMERLQKAAPNANFVKAFNSVGSAYMVNPIFKDGKPTMFICGNNDSAKNEIVAILDQLGWESEDCGGVKSARAIEPLCILWCIPGMLHNEWSHAFKLLKA